jgi:hypothetical protein
MFSTAKIFIGYAKKSLDTQKNKSSAQILSQFFFLTRKKKFWARKKKSRAQIFYFDAQNHDLTRQVEIPKTIKLL